MGNTVSRTATQRVIEKDTHARTHHTQSTWLWFLKGLHSVTKESMLENNVNVYANNSTFYVVFLMC